MWTATYPPGRSHEHRHIIFYNDAIVTAPGHLQTIPDLPEMIWRRG
jgi:hypothetical protein